jgi:hypothetical protein
MKKAVAFTLLGFFLLFGVSLVAGLHMFEPSERTLADKPGDQPPAPGEMSWDKYKRVKLALGAFDLVNGLTKHDLETIHTDNRLGFYYLVACLWLVLGMRLGFRWPHRKIKPGASAGD